MVTRQNKRGVVDMPSGSQAATLVALIAGMIVLYILFLPPSVREEILDSGLPTEDGVDGVAAIHEVLFVESPKRIDQLSATEIEHRISNLHLFSKVEGKELFKKTVVHLEKSWFDETADVSTFTIGNLELSDNFLLTFSALTHKGILTVKINGNTVYAKELTNVNPKPIVISKSILAETNTIEFSVDSPGWMFWNTHEYVLENIKLTADVTDLSNTEGQATFRVTQDELDNVDRSTLKFFVDCYARDMGRMELYLDDEKIFAAVPSCGAEFFDVTDSLVEGRNILRFHIDKGDYLINQITVKSKLREQVNPIYYFELGEDWYEKVVSDDYQANLHFDFTNPTDRKNARVIVNGHSMHLDTRGTTYTLTLDNFLNKGTNSIEIVPKDTMQVRKIEAFIE